MKSFLACALALAFGPVANAAPGPVGIWLGTLHAGAVDLRLAFHIEAGADGVLRGTFDSLDQGARGIALDEVDYDPPRLRLTLAKSGLRFEGTLDGDRLRGTFTQGVAMPLELARVDAHALEATKRPQTPKRPFPYREEEVTLEVPARSGPGTVRLAGTLSLPPGRGPFPALLFVTGSGSQDRDETIFEHKPFLVLSDALVRAGVATLRFDDRGMGRSGGSSAGLTTLDLAEDARAEVTWLAARPEIDRRAVGIIGHSEGGVVAPIVAASSRQPRFLVLLAGTGVPGRRVIHAQTGALLLAAAMSAPQIAEAVATNDRLLGLIEHEPDYARLTAQVREQIKDPKAQASALADLSPATLPWLRTFVSLDPASYLRRVKVPVLALNGDRDLQVDVSNLDAIARALHDGGDRDVIVRRLPGLNHLFQHAETGAVAEYARIEETMSPEVATLVRDFVLAHSPR